MVQGVVEVLLFGHPSHFRADVLEEISFEEHQVHCNRHTGELMVGQHLCGGLELREKVRLIRRVFLQEGSIEKGLIEQPSLNRKLGKWNERSAVHLGLWR